MRHENTTEGSTSRRARQRADPDNGYGRRQPWVAWKRLIQGFAGGHPAAPTHRIDGHDLAPKTATHRSLRRGDLRSPATRDLIGTPTIANTHSRLVGAAGWPPATDNTTGQLMPPRHASNCDYQPRGAISSC